MTQAEFSKGWKLLLLQPWAARYRSMTAAGQPSEEARCQMEFYFAKLQWADSRAWLHAADLFAQGNAWPSINDLRSAIQQVNHRYVCALNAPQPDYVPCPPEVREALRKILPGWADAAAGERGTA